MNRILESDYFYIFFSFIIFISFLFKFIFPRIKKFLEDYSCEIQNKFLDFENKKKELNFQITQEKRKIDQINDQIKKIVIQADQQIQFYSLKIEGEIAEETKNKLLFYEELKRRCLKKRFQDLIAQTGEEVYKSFLNQWQDSSLCLRGHQKKVTSSLNELSCFKDL